jgi:hypothetical protein
VKPVNKAIAAVVTSSIISIALTIWFMTLIANKIEQNGGVKQIIIEIGREVKGVCNQIDEEQ